MNDLLKKLNNKNISIGLINDQLDIKAPKGVMTSEILSEIKENKDALMSFISEFKTDNETNKSIPKSKEKSSYALSSSQFRLWLLEQSENNHSAYNMPSVFSLKGAIDINDLEKAFTKLIERHEILRTNILEDKTSRTPKQTVVSIDDFSFKLNCIDISNEENISNILENISEKEIGYKFDLESDALLRVSLIQKSKDDYILILVMHHIISDGWSSSIMIADLFSFYKSIAKGENTQLAPLTIQYKDFAEWQQNNLNSDAIQKDKKYWLKQFEKEVPILEIPTYGSRPTIKTYNGNTVEKTFERVAIQKFIKVCKGQGATLFMGLLSATKILLHKYTNQTDIVIGAPFAGRNHEELQNQIGFYVNTVGLRSSFKKEDTFIDLLRQVKRTTLEANSHQNYPFDELIKNLDIRTDRSRNPLFDVILTVDSYEEAATDLDLNQDVLVEEIQLSDVHSKFDLEFVFKEDKQGVKLILNYNTDIYSEDFILQATDHIEVILSSIVKNSELAIDSIPYLTVEEEATLIEKFNETQIDYNCSDKTYIDLFEEQVKKSPNNTAVHFESNELSYLELDKLSNQFAFYLIDNYNIEVEDFIGVKLERSDWLIVSFLAVLKTGAAYLPIDTTYPEERIAFIESDSNCKAIIDHTTINDFKNIRDQLTQKRQIKVSSSNLAYVIYTSGTTGTPKGTLIEHRSLLNLCFWHVGQYKVTESSKGTLYSGIAFDASIWEMCPYLLAGATLFPVPNQSIRLDLNRLQSFLTENEITHSYLPTSICHELVNDDFTSEDITILTGGDTLKITKQPKFKLYNNYGPTENTVVSTFFDLQDSYEYSIPIGKPISNTSAYILDDNLALLAVGIPGKLYVSGDSIARGYLYNQELTSERFMSNPFEEGERMYDTGDLAKLLPDGNIEFLGRKDSQVKIRGYRIELEEIEKTISQFSGEIRQVVLNISETEKEKELVAYYVTNTDLNKSDLRNFLQKRLPSYMVPNYYVELESISLTSNGKIDKKALPDITTEDLVQKEYVAPKSDLEKELVDIWQEVLGIENVGITDNFFELGGHSLLVGQIINRVHEQLNKKISFRSFFENPIIKDICKELSNSSFASIPKAEIQPYYPLTTSQNRIWMLSQLEGGNLAYNMSGVIKLTGNLNISLFEQAFKSLIIRHEILRTNFKVKELGKIYQFIVPEDKVGFSIPNEDAINKSEDDIKKLLQNNQAISFDLENDLLIRATLFKTEKEEHLFSFTMHHIIGDGWSMQLLISEVISTYNNLLQNKESSLSKLDIQYKDYAVWLQSELDKDYYKSSEEYWISQFQGEIPILNLPRFKNRPKVQTSNGKTLTHSYSKTFLEKLKSFSESKNATLFMTLMSGINTLLYRYTNQNDIILGTPIAGRDHPELESQIGLYLNTLAIRTKIEKTSGFSDLLESQKQTLLSAYEHQNYPFDELVNKLNLQRDSSRSVLFDVMVVLQNQAQLHSIKTDSSLNGLQVEDYEVDRMTAQFDMCFTFLEKEDLELSIEYNTDIYDEFLVERMFTHFENLMSQAIDKPNDSISSIEYLAQSEKQQLLQEFNDTAVDYPKDKTIIDLFEEQVEKTPNNIAVVFQDIKLSYSELNKKANQLAEYIRETYSIQPDDLIGLKIGRSEQLVVALLGILKAGAAYVPIDINYPQERINYIVKDSNCKVVIDSEELERFNTVKDKYSVENLQKINKPCHLAYVIYTSGTTGNPKGVMVELRNMVNLVSWFADKFINDQSRSISLTSFTFDPSIQDIFGTFIKGATLHLVTQEEITDYNYLGKYIETNGITILNYVPQYLGKLLLDNPKFDSLQTIVVGGEALPEKTKNGLIKLGYNLNNNYGPTEITVDALSGKMTDKSVHIGKPISNTRVYVLDEELGLIPNGVVGRLYISGDGLTRGYLNSPELTSSKFIQHPFEFNDLMYDTGDVVRWLRDGNIEFLGRNDSQVKIRGYRIELGEIESQILQISDALQISVVEPKVIGNEKQLVAYFSAKEKIDVLEIRDYLESKLPSYMVPSQYLQLKTIPVNENGKVDRKQLPEIDESKITKRDYLPPHSDLEKGIARIWSEVLKINKVGINDDFFELGGHSLKVMELQVRYREQFKKNILFKDLYANSKLYKQRDLLENSDYLQEETEIEPIDLKEDYSVSPSQARLWITSQNKETSIAYNMIHYEVISNDYSFDTYRSAISKVIERHESLRTTFIQNNHGEIRQLIHESKLVDGQCIEVNLSDNNEVKSYIEKDLFHQFDLEKGPLVKFVIFRTEEDSILYFNMHHIIGDDTSIKNLVQEIKFYSDKINSQSSDQLPNLRIQYKDYSHWINESETVKQNLVEQAKYWKNEFKYFEKVSELIPNYPRSVKQNHSGILLRTSINEADTIALKSIAQEHKLSTFSIVLAALKSTIYRYNYEKEQTIVVGTVVSERDQPDLQNQIGYYINTLPLKLDISSDDSLINICDRENDKLINAVSNKLYPYEQIILDLGIKSDRTRTLLFDVFATFQTNLESSGGNQQTEPNEISNCGIMHSKFDLEFTFNDTGESINIETIFKPSLYREDFIRDFLLCYKRILQALIENGNQKLSSLNLFSPNIYNKYEKTYPIPYGNLVDAFNGSVKNNPDKIAISTGEGSINFKELDLLSDRLAYQIHTTYSTKIGDRIGVQLERGINLIATLIAILKIKGTFIPIDINSPEEFKNKALKIANSKIVIDAKSIKEFMNVEIDIPNMPELNGENNEAYIIFTSGSSGEPKGVALNHSGLLNQAFSKYSIHNLQTESTLLHNSKLHFVGGTWQLWTSLIFGKKLVLCNELEMIDLKEQLIKVNTEKINLLELIPSHLSYYLSSISLGEKSLLENLKQLILTGEAFNYDLVEKTWVYNKELEIYNGYGQTESSNDTMIYKLDKDEKQVLIGKPIINTSNYILDAHLNVMPADTIGEIFTSGPGVSSGYINNVELTEKSFLKQLFNTNQNTYKTGDFGKILPSGNIKYIGRVDQQINILGYRIEIQEIEHYLLQIDKIQTCKVLYTNQKRLVAFITASESLSVKNIKRNLSSSLPSYKIPRRVIQLDSMPFLENQKINSKKLNEIDENWADKFDEKLQPNTEIERKLVAIWADILLIKENEIGIDESFFEIGGHSLQAISLINSLFNEFEIEISLKSLMEGTTITELGKLIENQLWLNESKEEKGKKLNEIRI